MVEMTNAQLTAEVDVLTEKVRQMKDLLGLFMVNGLADAFDGTGNQTYGGGIMRLDGDGIKIRGNALLGAIYFVSDFANFSSALAYSRISGYVLGDSSKIQLDAFQSGVSGAYISLFANEFGPNTIDLVAGDGGFVVTQSAGAAKPFMSLSDIGNTLLELGQFTSDPSNIYDGFIFYRSDLFRPRLRSNGITGNLGIEIQSATAPAVGNNGTITTAGVSVARVAPAGAVTGIILAVGTTGGQVCTVVNESVAANTVTFAAAGTSNVADGVASVIAGLTARRFTWDSSTALWYPTK